MKSLITKKFSGNSSIIANRDLRHSRMGAFYYARKWVYLYVNCQLNVKAI